MLLGLLALPLLADCCVRHNMLTRLSLSKHGFKLKLSVERRRQWLVDPCIKERGANLRGCRLQGLRVDSSMTCSIRNLEQVSTLKL